MIIEKKKLTELNPAPYNPRKSTAKQEEQLKRSLEKFGVVEPIIFNKQTGYIVGGHFRVRELKKLGYKEVDCVIVDLNEEDEKELNIRLNANTGEWNWDELNADWDSEQLEDWGLDIPTFETDDVLEAKEDDFDATPPEEPITVLGDLYEIGEHRLLCGDSTDSDQVAKLMNGELADMVFTDPPYNVAYEGGSKKRDAIANDKIDNFYQFLYDTYINCFLIMKDGSPIYIAHSELERINFTLAFLDAGFKFSSLIVWVKNNSTFSMNKDYKQKHEPIIYGWKQGASHTWEGGNCEDTVWEIKRPSKSELHPTMKPIELCERGIKNSSLINAIVYEPFTGSGSTMVASHQLKRKCYGMELDPKYCDVIVKRMITLDPNLTIKRNGVDVTNEWK
jgi:DNA modification methylase